MTFTFNTKHWNWFPQYWGTKEIELEDNTTKDGWVLRGTDDLITYLCYVLFAYDYVAWESIQEALYNVATELGCVYRNVYELEMDIRKYYI